jgi:Ni,Fe-hydrogenase III component G
VTEPAAAPLTAENAVMDKLLARFDFMRDKVRVQRRRRIFAAVEAADFESVFTYAQRDLGFTILCTITGVDNGATLGFIYHMARTDGIALSLQTDAPKDNPVINSVTRHFPCAEIYERELIDLLGAKIEGLTEGVRYPLSDDWPRGEYPLRKDWKKKAKAEEKPKDA